MRSPIDTQLLKDRQRKAIALTRTHNTQLHYNLTVFVIGKRKLADFYRVINAVLKGAHWNGVTQDG